MTNIKHKKVIIIAFVGICLFIAIIIWSNSAHSKKDNPTAVTPITLGSIEQPIDIDKVTQQAKEHDDRINQPDVLVQLEITERVLTKGPSIINLTKNQSARVEIRGINEEVRVKLEGYDIITENHPTDNVPGGFAFVADKVGKFNYYLLPEEDELSANQQPIFLGTINVE